MSDRYVREFHEAYGLPAKDEPFMPDMKRLMLRWKLINEEHQEVADEFERIARKLRKPGPTAGYRSVQEVYQDIARLAKELSDLRYVVVGTELEFGIPGEAVYAEVHSSNMSKLGADGKPIRRHDGKVLKGPNYREADVLRALGIITVTLEEEPTRG
jgi:predicted HAD superfamily Cof-like phosphohydrolase